MGRLIIVAGASGAGKSHFIKVWENRDPNARQVKKFVSEEREPRKREIETGETDLIFSEKYNPKTEVGKKWYEEKFPGVKVSDKLKFHSKSYTFDNVIKCELMYKYTGAYYEIDKDALEASIKEEKNTVIIVRNIGTIKRLFETYPDSLLIYVVAMLSGDDLRNALKKFGEDDIDIEERLKRTQDDLKDFCEHLDNSFPPYTIIPNDFREPGESSFSHLIQDVYRRRVETYNRPKGIFLVQSYRNKDDVMTVRNAIEAAFVHVFKKVPNFNTADKFRNMNTIRENAFGGVRGADYIVCDITNDRCDDCSDDNKRLKQGTSPNVWIELGAAIAQNKKVIIICKEDSARKRTEIPADLQGCRYITYKGPDALTTELEEELRANYN